MFLLYPLKLVGTFKSTSNKYKYYLFINIAGIQGLLRLKKLRVLNVGWNHLTTIPILSALPSLEVLDLSATYINSSQLQGVCILTLIKACGIFSVQS